MDTNTVLIEGISYEPPLVNNLKRAMDFTLGGIEAPVKCNEKRESNTVWCETIAFIAVPLHI